MANRNRIDDVKEHGGLNTDCFPDCQIFSGVAAMFLSPLYSFFLICFSMLQTLTGGATTLSVQSSCLAEMGKTNSNTQLSRWIINYLSKQYTARQTT